MTNEQILTELYKIGKLPSDSDSRSDGLSNKKLPVKQYKTN